MPETIWPIIMGGILLFAGIYFIKRVPNQKRGLGYGDEFVPLIVAIIGSVVMFLGIMWLAFPLK